MGHMRLPELAVKTVPDRAVAGPEEPRQVQTGPGNGVSLVASQETEKDHDREKLSQT